MRDENTVWNELFVYDDIINFIDYNAVHEYGSILSLTVHYIKDRIVFSSGLFSAHFIFIYISFSVVPMTLVKRCIFMRILMSICNLCRNKDD